MEKIGEAGRTGESVRSDCFIKIVLKESGGITLNVKSKVDFVYGDKIRDLLLTGLKELEIADADVYVEDFGALDFVIAARLECAVKRANPEIKKEFLLPPVSSLSSKSERERLRRSRLYLPGNEPKFFINASLHKPDGVILDLEDSVSPLEKDAARILVRNALRNVDFGDCERMVRINQGALGILDLEAIVPQNPQLILIPKVETGEHVRAVDSKIHSIKKEKGINADIFLMPIIESALGCFEASYIASSSSNVVALSIGLEDYTADIGAERTIEGKESFWARSVVVNAARAAGVQPIDSVFSDVNDNEGLLQSCLESKSMGFEGKGCIHPRQIPVIHQGFAPTPKEVEKAKRIVLAFEEAERKGLAVVSIGSKMVDPPVVKRALKTIS
ncbi:MAG: aldolase/citrate lyase family protein, partial [Acidobacteria bacterium]|nr:aldolase/citrate lyase family protein [Acidobacteriota bacterium]